MMYSNILVAIDIEDGGAWWRMLEQALACLDRENGRLRLLYVRSDLPRSWRDFAPPDFDSEEQIRCEKKLIEISSLVDIPAERISSVVRMGGVHNETLKEAESCRTDLIAVGPHRATVTSFLLGSSASAVVRYATIPVLVVR